MRKTTIIISSLIILAGVIFYSCSKEDTKPVVNKTEKIIPKYASPGYEAMIKKVAGILGSLLNITIDIKTGYYEAIYYPNGNLFKEICNPGDAICKLKITTSGSSINPDFILNGFIGKNEKGELLCCIGENVDPESYNKLFNSEGIINLTSDLLIDDIKILSTFNYQEPIVVKKGIISFQKIDGITVINLGVH